MRIRSYRNVSFSKNFADVLNGWSLTLTVDLVLSLASQHVNLCISTCNWCSSKKDSQLHKYQPNCGRQDSIKLSITRLNFKKSCLRWASWWNISCADNVFCILLFLKVCFGGKWNFSNSFLINVPILYPKNFKRPRVFWCFQGKKIGNIGQKWFTIASYHKLYGKTTYPLLTYYVLQNNIMRFCQSKNRTFISIPSQKNKITAN